MTTDDRGLVLTRLIPAPRSAPYRAWTEPDLLHWSHADREAHEAMGFHTGWGRCADQLAALAASR